MLTSSRKPRSRSRRRARAHFRGISPVFAISLCAAAWGGCVTPPPPYVRAYPDNPPIAHCFDGVPHQSGAKPWAMGGSCCCTPSDELMAKLHQDGVCTDLDTQGLVALYHSKGIQLAGDHQRCNNICSYGPHVSKGGKCMVPPFPGTRNFEEVATGIVIKPPESKKR